LARQIRHCKPVANHDDFPLASLSSSPFSLSHLSLRPLIFSIFLPPNLIRTSLIPIISHGAGRFYTFSSLLQTLAIRGWLPNLTGELTAT